MADNNVDTRDESKPPSQATEPGSLLLRLYSEYEASAGYLWPWETDRWLELVSCVLTIVSKRALSPEAVSHITSILDQAGVLDIERLGRFDLSGNTVDASDPFVVTISTVLQNSGLAEDEAHTAVKVICEVAAGFKRSYDGKMQKYLRHYGQLMLDELDQTFSFESLSNDQAKKIFSLWFQNVLNMPLTSSDDITSQACEMLGVDYDVLVKSADDVNVNTARLDDVLRAYWEEQVGLGQQEGSD